MFVLTSRSPVSWNFGPLYTVVSRKVSSSVLCSCVNFMVFVNVFYEGVKSTFCICPYYEDIINESFPY